LNWRVPLSDLILSTEDKTAVMNVLNSGWLTMGDVTQHFEEAFAEMVGVKHAIAVSNATVGLHLAILALQIGHGDEVILPSLSFCCHCECSALHRGHARVCGCKK